MMPDEMKLLEGYLSDIRGDIRGLRSDMHSFMALANKVDAEQGVSIADLQARMTNVERDVVDIHSDNKDANKDRSALWQKVWQFGITGAIIAQIVMGSELDKVVK